MISHTQAKDCFFEIMRTEPIYPFNYILKVSRSSSVLGSIAYLWSYFKSIENGRLKEFNKARECYLDMIRYLPDYAVNENYIILFNYFKQGLNYTPINISSVNIVYLSKKKSLF